MPLALSFRSQLTLQFAVACSQSVQVCACLSNVDLLFGNLLKIPKLAEDRVSITPALELCHHNSQDPQASRAIAATPNVELVSANREGVQYCE